MVKIGFDRIQQCSPGKRQFTEHITERNIISISIQFDSNFEEYFSNLCLVADKSQEKIIEGGKKNPRTWYYQFNYNKTKLREILRNQTRPKRKNQKNKKASEEKVVPEASETLSMRLSRKP